MAQIRPVKQCRPTGVFVWLQRQSVTNAIYYTFACYIENVGALIANIATRNLIGPQCFGANAFARSFSSYLDLGHGVQRAGILRELPDSIAAQKETKAQAKCLLQANFALLALVTAAESSLFLGASAYASDQLVAKAFLVLGLTGGFDVFAALFRTTLNAYSGFKDLAAASIVNGVLAPTVIVGLVYWKAENGLFIGLGFAALVRCFAYWVAMQRTVKVPIKWRWDTQSLKRTCVTGLGMQGPAIANQLLMPFIQMHVGLVLGYNELGYLSLALAGYAAVDMVGQAVLASYFPRFIERVTANSEPAVRLFASQLNARIALGLFVFLGIIIGLVPIAVGLLLPSYARIIPALQILIVASYCTGASQLPIFLLIARRQHFAIYLASALMTIVGFSSVLVLGHHGVFWVALSITAASATCAFVTTVTAVRLHGIGRSSILILIGVIGLLSASLTNQIGTLIYVCCLIYLLKSVLSANTLRDTKVPT